MTKAQKDYELRQLKKYQLKLKEGKQVNIEKRNKRIIKISKIDASKFEGTIWKEHFSSSNVWKFRRQGNDLYIVFLNGSIYKYPNAAKLFLGMLKTGSKGKYVWNQIRRKDIPYEKL